MMAKPTMMPTDAMMPTHGVMVGDDAKPFYDERGLWTCPHDGCKCTYKGLATLNRHYNSKHPNGQKPTWIYDTMTRMSAEKYNERKKAKATANAVPNANYQDFKSTQFKTIKAESPSMSFAEIMKVISIRWAELKQSAKAVVPTFTADEEDAIINEFLVKFVTNEPTEVAENLEGAEHQSVDTSSEVEGSNDAVDTSSEAGGSNECDDDESVVCSYDAELVACCKAWRCGGFVKAYRLLNDGKYSFKCQKQNKEGEPTRIYTVSKDGEPRKPTTLVDIKDALEHTFNELCYAWEDYKESNDYQEDECDFDDDMEWLDVCSQLVNADTIEMFMD